MESQTENINTSVGRNGQIPYGLFTRHCERSAGVQAGDSIQYLSLYGFNKLRAGLSRRCTPRNDGE